MLAQSMVEYGVLAGLVERVQAAPSMMSVRVRSALVRGNKCSSRPWPS